MARTLSSSNTLAEGIPPPEHGTVSQVEKLFGISRRVCNQKIRDGTFQSVVFNEAGSRKSVRLVYLASVRRYLRRQQIAGK